MVLRAGLLALPLALLLAGRFLPGPSAWGCNHFAYLPAWAYAAWIACAAAVALPAAQRRLAGGLGGRAGRALLETRWAPAVAAFAAGGVFALLRERSFFMGDGYLVGELIERGMPFRAFDNLDYLLHHQLYTRLHAAGSKLTSFDLYRIGSVIAGVAAVWTWTRLAARLPWEPWRRLAALGLLFLLGPVALFFGYVESYTFLFLFLTAFLLQGLRVLEGDGRLWVASAFFGAGLAFHLTAVFTGPALLYLALRAPVRPAGRRWLEAALPAAILFAISVALHVAEGYTAAWFRREFLEAQNTRNLWIRAGGPHGLFSGAHWRDLANLALITAPVCLALLAGARRSLRARWREAGSTFLLIQVASVAFFSVALDRKLGGARDWDLFAAHVGGLALLAARFLPAAEPGAERRPERSSERSPEPVAPNRERGGTRRGAPAAAGPHRLVGFALAAAALLSAPWVLLLHLEERSITRFVAVAAGFPDFQRGYAYEEVGKYYRKAGNLPRAEDLYELAVQANPTHPRLRVLMGAIYYSQDKLDEAEAEYVEAIRLDPKNHMAVEMMGKVQVQRQDPARAIEWFRKLVELRPKEAPAWELLGYSALRADRAEEALLGLGKAMALDPKLEYHHEVGVSLLRLGRLSEAVDAFHVAMQRTKAVRPETRIGLAWSRIEMIQRNRDQGLAVPEEWRAEAERELREVLASRPGSADANDLLRRLEHLKP